MSSRCRVRPEATPNLPAKTIPAKICLTQTFYETIPMAMRIPWRNFHGHENDHGHEIPWPFRPLPRNFLWP